MMLQYLLLPHHYDESDQAQQLLQRRGFFSSQNLKWGSVANTLQLILHWTVYGWSLLNSGGRDTYAAPELPTLKCHPANSTPTVTHCSPFGQDNGSRSRVHDATAFRLPSWANTMEAYILEFAGVRKHGSSGHRAHNIRGTLENGWTQQPTSIYCHIPSQQISEISTTSPPLDGLFLETLHSSSLSLSIVYGYNILSRLHSCSCPAQMVRSHDIRCLEMHPSTAFLSS
jgi:hypothetical protein